MNANDDMNKLTLRAHFAALAMQSFIPIVNEGGVNPDQYPAIIAKLAVMCADALLEALEEKP